LSNGPGECITGANREHRQVEEHVGLLNQDNLVEPTG
jgi:hypothetical protein